MSSDQEFVSLDVSDISGVHEGLRLTLNIESYDYSRTEVAFSGFKVGEELQRIENNKIFIYPAKGILSEKEREKSTHM